MYKFKEKCVILQSTGNATIGIKYPVVVGYHSYSFTCYLYDSSDYKVTFFPLY